MNESLERVFEYDGRWQVRTVVVGGEPWFVVDGPKEVITAVGAKLPTHFGCVYAVEYGEFLKIGRTTNPYQRFKSLATLAKNYGQTETKQALLSKPHTNFIETERTLHKIFAETRKSGELFAINRNQFISQVRGLELRDDSARLKEEAANSLRLFQALVLFGADTPGFVKTASKEG